MVKDDDPANIFGVVTKINVEKAINAFDPLYPTPEEDADDPAEPLRLIVDTPVVWTYLLRMMATVR